MDFASNYEIPRTADFIRSRNFKRVALQFPDELLKDATRVASALRDELWLPSIGESEPLDPRDVGIYVMADTTYGSCCVDEVGASHVDADCVVHYGHTCLSPTSSLPALFVFGKASIDVKACVESLSECLLTSDKPVMVLFGLEYAHSVLSIKEAMAIELARLCMSNNVLHYADVMCTIMTPAEDNRTCNDQLDSSNRLDANGGILEFVNSNNAHVSDHCKKMNMTTAGKSYSLGGLKWNLPQGHNMEDYLLFWIGSDNSAFANIVLTFNSCETVRFDAEKNYMVRDFSHQKRILKRRYYLVEKAKDANIIGILVGTLGVAGYLHMIHQMKKLIKEAGKKAYTLVMGRPNPAKLANFPECDVFIYVSCAQTALLDSKEFLAPVITPFEAMLAFNRGSQWTGSYVMEFRDLMASSPEANKKTEEARFSFLEGGYVEDFELQASGEVEEQDGRALVLAEATGKALKMRDEHLPVLVKGGAKSGAEFFATRSYHGLDMQGGKSQPYSFIVGRTGRASGYNDEKQKKEDS